MFRRTTIATSPIAAMMTALGDSLIALSVSSESKYLIRPADWEKPPPSFFFAITDTTQKLYL